MNLDSSTSQPQRAIVGAGSYRFVAVTDWAQRPAECTWNELAGVTTDRSGRVYLFARGPQPVMIFDADGTFLYSWGEGSVARAHGITIGPEENIYCTDDLDHTVKKYTPDGRLLMTLGTSGKPSDTGATSIDYRTIRHAGGPFYFPTNVAFSPEGEIYVTDGYGNARVHKFAADGRLLNSWGEPGDGPGQFHVPHGIDVDAAGRVFVADRENSRIQIFSHAGELLDIWNDIARPCQLFFDPQGNLLVAELGYRSGIWPDSPTYPADATGGRVSVLDPQGNVLARWGGGNQPTAPGDFYAPHDICMDVHGDIYVAEVTMSAGGNRGLVAADCHTLQKFVRI